MRGAHTQLDELRELHLEDGAEAMADAYFNHSKSVLRRAYRYVRAYEFTYVHTLHSVLGLF